MGCSSQIVTVTALKLGLKPVLSPSSLCVKCRPSGREQALLSMLCTWGVGVNAQTAEGEGDAA